MGCIGGRGQGTGNREQVSGDRGQVIGGVISRIRRYFS